MDGRVERERRRRTRSGRARPPATGRRRRPGRPRSPPGTPRARTPARRRCGRPARAASRRRSSAGDGLDRAVADHPHGEERADLPEAPAELGAQEDGQADDEPDVARGEQEDARRGEHVDRAVVREHLRELRLAVRRGPACRASASARRPARRATSAASISSAGWKPTTVSRRPPRKKPTPLSAFFEPVRIATQRKSASDAPSGTTSLTALLELIFVRSFAMPDSAWAAITYGTTSQRVGHEREHARARRAGCRGPSRASP